LKETFLSLHNSNREIRKLRAGDIVYVSGLLHTMRDMAHRRAVEMLNNGQDIPFSLVGGTIWHCGPIVSKKNERWQVLAAGPTSSSRLTELGARLVKELSIRIVIGKGNMGEAMVAALRKVGGCYLHATGGCAALYAKQISKVRDVYWSDLGMPEAVWVLDVENLGPLTVEIDSKGGTLHHNVYDNVRKSIQEIYRQEEVDARRTCIWWPRSLVGTKHDFSGAT
jgi:tartrate/fumarate subfamily iron-sulfur-dependent hydro-lyase beta chain